MSEYNVKVGLAEMLKGGVIMDVTNVEQAKIAEDSGAVSVMALERIPSDIRKDGGIARMSDPKMIEEIQKLNEQPTGSICYGCVNETDNTSTIVAGSFTGEEWWYGQSNEFYGNGEILCGTGYEIGIDANWFFMSVESLELSGTCSGSGDINPCEDFPTLPPALIRGPIT